MPKYLNDKMMTLKLTMLIALASSARAHETSSLNIDFLVKHPAHYSFHLKKNNRKTARQGQLRLPVELTQFSDKNICVCHHIDVYLERAKVWRKMKDNFYQVL